MGWRVGELVFPSSAIRNQEGRRWKSILSLSKRILKKQAYLLEGGHIGTEHGGNLLRCLLIKLGGRGPAVLRRHTQRLSPGYAPATLYYVARSLVLALRLRSRLWSSLSYTSALPRPGRAGGGKNQFASVAKQALVRARAARNRNNKKKNTKISWRESLAGNRIRSLKPCGPRRKLKRACIGEQHQNRGR